MEVEKLYSSPRDVTVFLSDFSGETFFLRKSVPLLCLGKKNLLITKATQINPDPTRFICFPLMRSLFGAFTGEGPVDPAGWEVYMLALRRFKEDIELSRDVEGFVFLGPSFKKIWLSHYDLPHLIKVS